MVSTNVLCLIMEEYGSSKSDEKFVLLRRSDDALDGDLVRQGRVPGQERPVDVGRFVVESNTAGRQRSFEAIHKAVAAVSEGDVAAWKS